MSNGVCEPVSHNQQLTVQDPEGNTVVFVQSGSTKHVAQSTPTSNAISRRIIHAGFVVKSEAAENAFYHDVLGFKPYWHVGMRDGVTDWASPQVPNGTDWIEYMLNIKPDASPNTLGVMDHVSLGVEKMDSAVTSFRLAASAPLLLSDHDATRVKRRKRNGGTTVDREWRPGANGDSLLAQPQRRDRDNEG